MVNAVLKWLSWDSPDCLLADFVPEDPLNVSLDLLAGIGEDDGTEAADNFQIRVCTLRRLAAHYAGRGITLGTGMIVVERYEYEPVHEFIADYVKGCSGRTWLEAALRVSRLGHWEFDGDAYLALDFDAWVDRADTLIREKLGAQWDDSPISFRLERGRPRTTKARTATWSGPFGNLNIHHVGETIEVRQSCATAIVRCCDRYLMGQDVGWFVAESLDFLRGLGLKEQR